MMLSMVTAMKRRERNHLSICKIVSAARCITWHRNTISRQQQQQQDGNKTAASLGSQFSSFFLRPSLARGASSNNSNSHTTTSSIRSRSSFKFNHTKSIDNDESIIELQRVSLSLADFKEVNDSRISIAPRSNTSSESSIHNPMETMK